MWQAPIYYSIECLCSGYLKRNPSWESDGFQYIICFRLKMVEPFTAVVYRVKLYNKSWFSYQYVNHLRLEYY